MTPKTLLDQIKAGQPVKLTGADRVLLTRIIKELSGK